LAVGAALLVLFCKVVWRNLAPGAQQWILDCRNKFWKWIKIHWDIPGWILIVIPNFVVSVLSSVPGWKYHSAECLALLATTTVIFIITLIRRLYMRHYQIEENSSFWPLFFMVIAGWLDGMSEFVGWDYIRYPDYQLTWLLASIILGAISIVYSLFCIGIEIHLRVSERTNTGGDNVDEVENGESNEMGPGDDNGENEN
jgi:hypothetical protein